MLGAKECESRGESTEVASWDIILSPEWDCEGSDVLISQQSYVSFKCHESCMTKILDWRKSDDPRDIVHLAVQALAEGHVVALPSNCAYLLVASGLKKDAVSQLAKAKSSLPLQGVSLMVRSADETLDYFPDITPAARRLARKVWPAPVILSLPDSRESSLLRCLDTQVQSELKQPSDRVHVWQPCHEVLEHVCRLASGPLLCTQAIGVGDGIADSVETMLPGQSVLTIDAGCVDVPGSPTVVQIDGNQGHIAIPGVVDQKTLRDISQWTVLFVCTGNTCRSPMAQAMMQRKITERFNKLAVEGGLPIVAVSAGVSALGGDPASHGAATAIRKFGTDLDRHQSTQLNAYLVEQADLILAMGNRHRHVIVSQWPSTANKVFLISPDGGEISDPFGGPIEVYEKCARQLDEHTDYWIDRLDMESLIQWR